MCVGSAGYEFELGSKLQPAGRILRSEHRQPQPGSMVKASVMQAVVMPAVLNCLSSCSASGALRLKRLCHASSVSWPKPCPASGAYLSQLLPCKVCLDARVMCAAPGAGSLLPCLHV
eukprot:1159091-Pelagomonas_calceolata.AAC.5